VFAFLAEILRKRNITMTVIQIKAVAPNTDPTTAPAITPAVFVPPPLAVGLGAAVVKPGEAEEVEEVEEVEEAVEVEEAEEAEEVEEADNWELVVVALTDVGRA
jgi:hypothetical protein